MMTRSLGLIFALGLAVSGAPSASAADYWDLSGGITDNDANTRNDLIHGTSQQHDLEFVGFPDEDWYVALSYPEASYEAVIDSTSLFIGFLPTHFNRLDSTATTVLQTSENANPSPFVDHSQALRWQSAGTTIDRQFLRVQIPSCDASCTPNHQYHIRFYETTVAVPRFNNAGSQLTVLIIQNSTGWTRPIAGTVYFHNAAGTLLGSTTFSLAANAALVLNTATVPGVAGVSGTIKVAHDGGYGNLAMKSVALEPATGFSFDSPGTYKPQ